jgi:hypothetical protein
VPWTPRWEWGDRRTPGKALLPLREALIIEPADGGVEVDGRPERGAVKDHTERAQ